METKAMLLPVAAGVAVAGGGAEVVALAGKVVEAFGADLGESDVAVEGGVMGEEDALAAALAEEAFDAVAAGDEGGGEGLTWRCRSGLRSIRCRTRACRLPGSRLRYLDEGQGVFIALVDAKHAASLLND